MVVPDEDQQGALNRVQSSLELLCHTAVLRNDIEKGASELLHQQQQLQQQQQLLARVTPAEGFSSPSRKYLPSISNVTYDNSYEATNKLVNEICASPCKLMLPLAPSLPRSMEAFGSREVTIAQRIGTMMSNVSGFPWADHSASMSKPPSPNTLEDDYAFAYDNYTPRLDLCLKQSNPDMLAAVERGNDTTRIMSLHTHDYASAFAAAAKASAVPDEPHLDRSGARRVVTAPVPLVNQSKNLEMTHTATVMCTTERLQNENLKLCDQLASRDETIKELEKKVSDLEKQVQDLRELPTGKISQIPIADMLEIMHDYGSEVSENAVPPRKDNVQKASVVRQFRRWNPNFLEYFIHKSGKWIPKLGKKGEIERRAQARLDALRKRGSSNGSKSNMNAFSAPNSPTWLKGRRACSDSSSSSNSCSSSLSSGCGPRYSGRTRTKAKTSTTPSNMTVEVNTQG